MESANASQNDIAKFKLKEKDNFTEQIIPVPKEPEVVYDKGARAWLTVLGG